METRFPAARRVLLPFDESRAGRAAVAHVVRHHAECFPKAEVIALNVQRVYLDAELAHEARAVAWAYRLAGERVLRPAVKAMALAGIPCRSEVFFGSPAPAIVRAAAALECDLVVMGTRNLPRFLRLLARSVAQRVRDACPVPVRIVHAESARARGARFDSLPQGAPR